MFIKDCTFFILKKLNDFVVVVMVLLAVEVVVIAVVDVVVVLDVVIEVVGGGKFLAAAPGRTWKACVSRRLLLCNHNVPPHVWGQFRVTTAQYIKMKAIFSAISVHLIFLKQ